MPIGIVSDEELQKELESLSGKRVSSPLPLIPEILPLPVPSHGRNNGDNNVPDSLRKIIGETAVIDGRAAGVKLARDFGISPSSVSAYAKGATSTTSYNSPKETIISHINKSRARAVKKASKTLNAALGAITQDKLDYSDAKDLSGIAKDMAVIIKNLEPQTNGGDDPDKKAPQFVIFAPQFRDERSFDTIHVPE